MKFTALLLCCGVVLSNGIEKQQRRFPDDFLFGAATAAYQVEGGWNADGKGENIWDYLTHNMPEAVVDQSNGDMAADSYHNYKRDVEMMRELGLDMYRFSLSWSRILPNGFANTVNEAGIAFYNDLIDEMLKYNIKPMVTLYHWDLPQRLQNLGGFANPLIAEWFEDFARVAFENFGDRVKHWITFNEPYQICFEGYGYVTKAPMLNITGVGEYICDKNLLLAHARAYHAYNNDFKATQDGVCGFTVAMSSTQPLTDSELDKYAVELYNQFEWAIYTDPIFSKEGGFPVELSDILATTSAEQGYSRSILPAFTAEEKAMVRGTSDFFGINHYGGAYITAMPADLQSRVTSYGNITIQFYSPEDWPQAASIWLKQMPNSIYIVLNAVKERYGDIPIFITENGWSTRGGLEDNDRIFYYRAALESALDALDAGINLQGYVAWSLMDNFEWLQGYTERFGLYQVDFDDPARPRTPRKSAFVYKHILKTRAVDHDYEPDNYVMTIDEGH